MPGTGTVKEVYRGIRGDQDRREIEYLVYGADNDNDALDIVEGIYAPGNPGAPASYDNMPRENVTIKEEIKTATAAKNLHRAVAQYTRRSNRKSANATGFGPVATELEDPASEDSDKESFAFEVSLESNREYFPRSLNLVSGTPSGNRVEIAAGRQRDGLTPYEPLPWAGFGFEDGFGFRGFDVQRSTSTFSLTVNPTDAQVTRSYQKTVQDAVGTLNNATFRKWEIREVMMIAARGESRNSADWQFTFTFQARKHFVDIDLGNFVTIGKVEAWDKIDPYYIDRDVDTAGNKFTIRECRQAQVWRVYEESDFKELFPV